MAVFTPLQFDLSFWAERQGQGLASCKETSPCQASTRRPGPTGHWISHCARQVDVSQGMRWVLRPLAPQPPSLPQKARGMSSPPFREVLRSTQFFWQHKNNNKKAYDVLIMKRGG